ncbi:hypothetical protein Tco_0189511 [Tanacetum coccineum]
MSAAANTTPILTTVTKTANKEKTQKERNKVNIQDFCEEHYEDILPIINTTPIVATVTKTANKEKTQKEMDKVNIQDFCEEHYDDILPIIMDKVRRDKRKEVHARLDFEESPEKSQRAREDSQNSSVGVSLVRNHTPSRRPRVQDRLRYNDGNVFNRLSRRRRSVHERLNDTYSPSMTRSSRKTRMPSNVKTYDGTGDPEDHLKVFQASAPSGTLGNAHMVSYVQLTIIWAARVMKKPCKEPSRNDNTSREMERRLRNSWSVSKLKLDLKKQIEELVKAGKLSDFIKEIRQDKDKQKNGKKEAPTKEKATAIYMIQPELEGPLVIEAEIKERDSRHYVDGWSHAKEVL